MSYRPVSKQIYVHVCDLCGEEIPEVEDAHLRGSVTSGYIAHKVTNRTKRAWLKWPPDAAYLRPKPEGKPREYDFHGECIVRLVEANLFDFAASEGSNK